MSVGIIKQQQKGKTEQENNCIEIPPLNGENNDNDAEEYIGQLHEGNIEEFGDEQPIDGLTDDEESTAPISYDKFEPFDEFYAECLVTSIQSLLINEIFLEYSITRKQLA